MAVRLGCAHVIDVVPDDLIVIVVHHQVPRVHHDPHQTEQQREADEEAQVGMAAARVGPHREEDGRQKCQDADGNPDCGYVIHGGACSAGSAAAWTNWKTWGSPAVDDGILTCDLWQAAGGWVPRHCWKRRFSRVANLSVIP